MSHSKIVIENVTLNYELHFERSVKMKDFIINKIKGRRYLDKDKEEILALKDINLQINEGERVGIIGFNGAGKSTLLKVIAGILKPSLGHRHVSGTVQPMIEFGAGFNPEFTGRENIYFNGYMLGFTKKEIRAREQAIIDFSELGKFIDVPVKYYSSGMSVRLSFSLATCIKPEVLVFDEMLSAGDASFIAKATRRMNNLLDEAKILVLVSHDLNVIEQTCRRVIILEKGHIIFDGPTKNALDHYHRCVEQASQLTHREML
ncbi:MAG: hypothetical protein A4S09_02465 [Proteobacteria bacterium SG_bin7]|nr:MAG: hypothetical protein A4S09_02465 [Proteobacteria bacterium SG_bin7]